MSALQVRDIDPEESVVFRSLLHRIAERGDRVDAAGAADEDLALVLRIEVDEVFARKHIFAQLEGSGQARLLVDRKERFDGAVLHGGVDQDSQRGGHADTAVGAERRAFGPDPPAVDARADRVPVEIELHVGVLLADHVHMRLEDNRRTVLEARRGGLAHHHVADGVLLVFEIVLPGEIDQKFDDPALLLRGARNPCDGVELLPDDAGFQIGNC